MTPIDFSFVRLPSLARSSATAVLLLAGLVLSACGRAPAPDEQGVAKGVQAPSQVLDALVEDYYEQYLKLNPLAATANGDMRFNDRLPNTLSEQWLADLLALEQDALARLTAIDPTSLDEKHRLTYDSFRYGRELAVEGFRFPDEQLPFNQFFGLPVFFGQMGAGNGIQPFATVQDYDNFLARMRDFVVWADQAIANMKTGMEQGVVQPKVLVERSIPQIASFLVNDPATSVFAAPVNAFPESIPAADRKRLSDEYAKAIAGELLPAYRRLHDFLAKEYLPAARETIAATALPNGAAWYAHQVRMHTTTTLSPDEIHRIGLDEVRRIKGEMEQVKARLGFTGDLPAFFAYLRTDPMFRFESPEQLVDAYRTLQDKVAAAIPAQFTVVPKSGFEVRVVESFREQSEATASYMPGTPDGVRPGVFYVNTYDLSARPSFMSESIFLHEAIPGHHFQISLQQEIADLPRFRRFGGDTAYVEGWGLYAESLGRELGLYTDPYQYFGSLTAEMWRAVRLVVDTGMHAKGWSRERAIDYMRQNTALGEADIVAEVERYIAEPGQSLAYKIGQRKIRELKERAMRTLKDRFDVKAFHAQILMDGSLPLDVLDAKVARWIEATAARPTPPAQTK
ncbi:MAG: DUF885 domain-containing protein [Steroidobacteraceae bacterium]